MKNFAKFKKLKIAKINFGTDFLTLKVKKTFAYLQKTFIKALIPYYFNLESYIQIKIDALGCVISEILS